MYYAALATVRPLLSVELASDRSIPSTRALARRRPNSVLAFPHPAISRFSNPATPTLTIAYYTFRLYDRFFSLGSLVLDPRAQAPSRCLPLLGERGPKASACPASCIASYWRGDNEGAPALSNISSAGAVPAMVGGHDRAISPIPQVSHLRPCNFLAIPNPCVERIPPMANSPMVARISPRVAAAPASHVGVSFFPTFSQGPPLTTVSGNINPFAGRASFPGLNGSNTDFSNRRCREKGCVFPAARSESGRCLQHDRQYSEPALFHSQQPSMLLLDQAKFGLPDSEPDDSRARDRRRFAVLREANLDEAS